MNLIDLERKLKLARVDDAESLLDLGQAIFRLGFIRPRPLFFVRHPTRGTIHISFWEEEEVRDYSNGKFVDGEYKFGTKPAFAVQCGSLVYNPFEAKNVEIFPYSDEDFEKLEYDTREGTARWIKKRVKLCDHCNNWLSGYRAAFGLKSK